MTRLSVNINKIATLRNARGGNVPDLAEAARRCESFGAEGITVHPRPDERHIRYSDIPILKSLVTTEFNIEGYPSEDFIRLVERYRPHQVTLVPDPPHVLTSSEGWDTRREKEFLKHVIARLKASGMRVSIFMGTDPELIQHAGETGADRIELYTGPYAEQYKTDREASVKPFAEAARMAVKSGMGVNAGHDLNLENLRYLKQQIPELLEVSIGHALIADALYLGLEETIKQYLHELKDEA